MVRTALVLTALAAFPAWAVGERIILPSAAQPFTDQIKDTLCISMECVADKSGGLDATIIGKLVKGKKGQTVELQVLASSGVVKATVKAPVGDNGRMSSMDLVTASSAVIAAIEAPETAAKAKAPAQVAKVQKKKSQLRLAAKSRIGHGRG